MSEILNSEKKTIINGLRLFVNDYEQIQPFLGENGNVRYYFSGSIAMMLLSKVKSFETILLDDKGNIKFEMKNNTELNDKARDEYAKSEREIKDIDTINIAEGISNPSLILSKYAINYGITKSYTAPQDILSGDKIMHAHIVAKCQLQDGGIIYMAPPATMICYKIFDVISRIKIYNKKKESGEDTTKVGAEIKKRIKDLIYLIKGLASFDKNFVQSIADAYEQENLIVSNAGINKFYDNESFIKLIDLIKDSGLINENEFKMFEDVICCIKEQQEKREEIHISK